MRRRIGVILFFAALLIFISCSKESKKDIIDEIAKSFGDPVKVSESDSTPPSISLVFNDPSTGKKIVLKPTDAPITIPIKVLDRFYVVAIAEDQQGVKDVRIRGTLRKRCKSGDYGMLQTGHIFADFPGNAGVGDWASTRRWLPKLVDGRFAKCTTKGWELVSYSISLHAEAENFSGLITRTPSVTFTVKP
jgi:hypothetical protein